MPRTPKTRICRKCKKRKSLKKFHKSGNRSGGYNTLCALCENIARGVIRDNNRESHREKNRIHKFKRKGIDLTLEQIAELRSSQSNLCAICGQPETYHVKGLVKSLALDHCHKTNKLRGLLCRKCNIGLGGFEDDISKLQAAIAYLQRYSILDAMVELKPDDPACRDASLDKHKLGHNRSDIA